MPLWKPKASNANEWFFSCPYRDEIRSSSIEEDRYLNRVNESCLYKTKHFMFPISIEGEVDYPQGFTLCCLDEKIGGEQLRVGMDSFRFTSA
jgi:hypothetical protein